MTATNPSGHVAAAEHLLTAAEQMIEKQVVVDPMKAATSTVLCALTHAVLALARAELEKRL